MREVEILSVKVLREKTGRVVYWLRVMIPSEEQSQELAGRISRRIRERPRKDLTEIVETTDEARRIWDQRIQRRQKEELKERTAITQLKAK